MSRWDLEACSPGLLLVSWRPRDEAFQVHNDPAGSLGLFWSFLGRVFPLSLKGPTRRTTTARSAESAHGLRAALARGFSLSRVWPSLRLHAQPEELTAPFCILPDSDSDSAFPCFRVSCFCFCSRFAGKHTSEPCTARIASLRPSQHFLDTEQATATAQTQTNIFLRGQAAQPVSCSPSIHPSRTHHAAACKRLKTSLASPCHERPRGHGQVQTYSVPEIGN